MRISSGHLDPDAKSTIPDHIFLLRQKLEPLKKKLKDKQYQEIIIILQNINSTSGENDVRYDEQKTELYKNKQEGEKIRDEIVSVMKNQIESIDNDKTKYSDRCEILELELEEQKEKMDKMEKETKRLKNLVPQMGGNYSSEAAPPPDFGSERVSSPSSISNKAMLNKIRELEKVVEEQERGSKEEIGEVNDKLSRLTIDKLDMEEKYEKVKKIVEGEGDVRERLGNMEMEIIEKQGRIQEKEGIIEELGKKHMKLKKKHGRKEKECEKVSKELEDLSRKFELIESEREHMVEDLSQKNMKIHDLNAQSGQYTTQIEQVNAQLTHLQQEFEDLNIKHSTLHTQHKGQTEEFEQFRHLQTEKGDHLQNLTILLSEKEASLDELKIKVFELEEEIQGADGQLDVFKLKSDHDQKYISDYQRKITSLEGNHNELKDSSSKLQSSLTTTISENEQLKQDVKKLRGALKSKDQKLELVNYNKEKMEQLVLSATDQQEAMKEKAEELESAKNALDVEIAGLRRECEKKEKVIRESYQKYEEQKKEHMGVKGRLHELQELVAKEEEEKNLERERLTNIVTANEKFKSRIDTLEVEIVGLRGNEERLNDVLDLNSELNSKLLGVEGEIRKMKQELEAKNSENEGLIETIKLMEETQDDETEDVIGDHEHNEHRENIENTGENPNPGKEHPESEVAPSLLIQEENNQLRAEIVRYKEDQFKLESEYSKYKNEYEGISLELECMRKEQEERRRKEESTQESADKLGMKYMDVKKYTEELQEELRVTCIRMEKPIEENRRLTEEKKRLQDELNIIKKDMKILEKKMKGSQKAENNVMSKIGKMEEERFKLITENTECHQQISHHKKVIEEQRSTFDNRDKDYNSRIKGLEDESGLLRQEITFKEKQIKDGQHKIGELEIDLEKSQNFIEDMQQRRTSAIDQNQITGGGSKRTREEIEMMEKMMSDLVLSETQLRDLNEKNIHKITHLEEKLTLYEDNKSNINLDLPPTQDSDENHFQFLIQFLSLLNIGGHNLFKNEKSIYMEYSKLRINIFSDFIQEQINQLLIIFKGEAFKEFSAESDWGKEKLGLLEELVYVYDTLTAISQDKMEKSQNKSQNVMQLVEMGEKITDLTDPDDMLNIIPKMLETAHFDFLKTIPQQCEKDLLKQMILDQIEGQKNKIKKIKIIFTKNRKLLGIYRGKVEEFNLKIDELKTVTN